MIRLFTEWGRRIHTPVAGSRPVSACSRSNWCTTCSPPSDSPRSKFGPEQGLGNDQRGDRDDEVGEGGAESVGG